MNSMQTIFCLETHDHIRPQQLPSIDWSLTSDHLLIQNCIWSIEEPETWNLMSLQSVPTRRNSPLLALTLKLTFPRQPSPTIVYMDWSLLYFFDLLLVNPLLLWLLFLLMKFVLSGCCVMHCVEITIMIFGLQSHQKVAFSRWNLSRNLFSLRHKNQQEVHKEDCKNTRDIHSKTWFDFFLQTEKVIDPWEKTPFSSFLNWLENGQTNNKLIKLLDYDLIF